MNAFSRFAVRPCRWTLAGALVLALFFGATPIAAAGDLTGAETGSMLVLFGGTLRSVLLGGGRRGRIVQICVLCMAVALFILMKKFSSQREE